MNVTLPLYNPQQAAVVMRQAWPEIKSYLMAGKRLQFSIKAEKRSTQQNRRYWGAGVLKQVAEQAVVNGHMFSAEAWHEQFKRQFIGVEQLPSGEVIGKSSTGLTKAEFSDFCQKVEAFAATELGVVFFDLPKE